MGFSLTGSHVVFFIAALVIAGVVSGVFVAVTLDVSNSLSNRGDRVKDELDTDFEIINDPDNIPTAGSDYIFYIKNIGGCEIATSNTTFQVFLDGDLVAVANYNFTDTSIQPGECTRLYAEISPAAGYHKFRVVGPMAVSDEFTFNV